MLKSNNQRGITLVALVITIIVLLILAGVTISLVMGNNGIINYSKQSKEKYVKASLKEEIEFLILDIETEETKNNRTLTIDTIVAKLPIKSENIEEIQKVNLEAEGIYKGYDFIITKDFEVIIGGKVEGALPRPEIVAEIVTGTEAVDKVQLKITATLVDGTITELLSLTTDETIKEISQSTNTKIYEITANGEYSFKATGSNGQTRIKTVPIKTVRTWSEIYNERLIYIDAEKQKATIPKGFQVSKGIGETLIREGLVVRDGETKNEFIWIPVNNIENYKRTDFGSLVGSYGSYANYYETIPSDEEVSVKNYKGYYIGRYMSGNMSKLVILKDSNIYNYVNISQAKSLSAGLYTNKEEKSKLCSGYAWDTALNFIESNNSGYVRKTVYTGGSSASIKTGTISKVNNIYDMGYIWELTSESNNISPEGPVTLRGRHIIANRYPFTSAQSDYDCGFRVSLYL